MKAVLCNLFFSLVSRSGDPVMASPCPSHSHLVLCVLSYKTPCQILYASRGQPCMAPSPQPSQQVSGAGSPATSWDNTPGASKVPEDCLIFVPNFPARANGAQVFLTWAEGTKDQKHLHFARLGWPWKLVDTCPRPRSLLHQTLTREADK